MTTPHPAACTCAACLDRMDALAKAATPGRHVVVERIVGLPEAGYLIVAGGYAVATLSTRDGDADRHDAEFYAAARDAVPALVRALREANARRCAQPDVALCAREWQADHQAAALRAISPALAEEFGAWGCDAIEQVAEALVASRALAEKRREALEEACARMGHHGHCPAADTVLGMVQEDCTCGLDAARAKAEEAIRG